jgi:phosphonate transport system substrate-binding protein
MMRTCGEQNGTRDSQAGKAKTAFLVVVALLAVGALAAITHFYRLEKKVGVEELHIEIRIAETSLDAIEAFGGGSRGGAHGSADVGLLNLFEYVLARKEYGVEAALQVLRAGDATGYHGVIAVRADDPAQSPNDLRGKRVAFVDPYSTSGFVFTARILRDAGVDVQPEFAGNHAEALRRLKAGEADAAATFATAVESDPSLRVIVRTDTIPNEPIFFRREVRAEKRVAIVNALAKLASTPEGARLLESIADITDVRPVNDDDYREVVDAIRAAGKSVYEVVPEGLQVESRRRGINYIP